MSAHYGVAG